MRKDMLGLLVLLVGCNPIFGPDERREIGIIQGLGTDAPAIQLPATVEAGQEFTVTIGTTWSDLCARRGTVEILSDGRDVVLTPYDYVTEGAICGQMVQGFTHTATLRLTSAGGATILIRGRTGPRGEVVAVEREIIVR